MNNPERWEIIVGDCREILDTLPEQSVQCVVTSPPYWGQRDYGVDGMIGLETDVQEWVATMVEVFRKVRRVLRDDGTVWLNLGDKYAGSGGAGGDYNEGGVKAGVEGGPVASPVRKSFRRDKAEVQAGRTGHVNGYKAKDLMGLPWRVAFALQDDGWYLRRDIIWHKPNPMPESATDRPATAHEYIFLLTKQPRYFYDADAVRHPHLPVSIQRVQPHRAQPGASERNGAVSRPDAGPNTLRLDQMNHPGGAGLRSVWKVPTQAFGGPHYATYPEKLVEPCIKAGTSERGECSECGSPWKRVVDVDYVNPDNRSTNGPRSVDRKHLEHGTAGYDQRLEKQTETIGWRSTCDHDADPVPQTVLDPFSGAGTTGLVATKLGRRYIGIELNPEYAEMSRHRIVDGVGAASDETANDLGRPVQGQMFT